MVLGRQKRDDGLTVDEAEEGDLRAIQEGLQQHRVAGGIDCVDVCAGLLTGFGHHHSLAAGEAVILDHKVRAKAVEGRFNVGLRDARRKLFRAGGAHAGDRHDVLGEGLGPLNLSRACRRPEHRNATLPQGISHTVDQRDLRSNDDEVRSDVKGELHHAGRVIHLGVLRVDRGLLRVRRGARSDVEIGHERISFEAGEQGVFAAARANYEYAHDVHLNWR